MDEVIYKSGPCIQVVLKKLLLLPRWRSQLSNPPSTPWFVAHETSGAVGVSASFFAAVWFLTNGL